MHHCKITSYESALFFSFTNIVAKFEAVPNKIEEGLSGLPLDRAKNNTKNNQQSTLPFKMFFMLYCTSAFKHFRTDTFILV